MTLIPIDENEIASARSLPTEIARFWSTAQGEPSEIYDEFVRATQGVPGIATRSVTTIPVLAAGVNLPKQLNSEISPFERN